MVQDNSQWQHTGQGYSASRPPAPHAERIFQNLLTYRLPIGYNEAYAGGDLRQNFDIRMMDLRETASFAAPKGQEVT